MAVRATVAAAATVAALTMTGCTVEIVDDGPSGRTLTSDPPRPAPPTGGEPQEPTEPEESTEPVEPEPDDEASEPAPDQGGTSAFPTREDLLPLTTAQTACGGGDLTRDRAGDAVEITDSCSTLTLGGASSVVVAGEVTDLVVTASGVRVAVQSVARVTISAANVTVTWEDGSPTVTDEGPGNTYGSVDVR